ncbi:MAG TPA: TlpA disulfide reductase family protein [Candidatus Krumholzibacteria bacterium]|nr:TlpA disulfide reductase family protein [Candidatus Krumholzibacteria bacterium]HRX51690.1 TlpA disulfide reductase family protein [Candidatus Krumholzibacteria bacterium]
MTRTMTTTTLAGLLILALALTGCNAETQADAGAEHAAAKSAPAAEAPAAAAGVHALALPSLDGGTLKLADWAGDVILVDFWATWCGPCRRVMPSLEEIHNELGAQGVRIVAVSTDREGAPVVAPFIEKNGYTFPVALLNQEALKVFGDIQSIPTTFIVKGDGTIAERLVGAHPKAEYLAAIERAKS